MGWAVLDGGLLTCKALCRLYHFEDGVVPARADVERGEIRPLIPHGQGHSAGDVGNVGQIAALVAIPVDPDGTTLPESLCEGG